MREHTPRLVTSEHGHNKVHGEHALGRFNKRIAVAISIGFGSMWAFWILVAWQLGWMAWQGSGIGLVIKDPYPFTFLLFLSNLIQLWALPAIMVGQNVQTAHNDEQAKADHETLSLLYKMQVTQTEILQYSRDKLPEILRLLEKLAADGRETGP